MFELKLGIIGAGKVGTALARLAVGAGYEVSISASGSSDKIAMIVNLLAPGAIPKTNHDVIAESDIIILALPLSKFRDLNQTSFAGKIVIDAMNYWWEIDGTRADILPDSQSTSEYVQESLRGARVVKAFNHMGYHELDSEHRSNGQPDRKAIALASDDADAAAIISTVIDDLGFDPLNIGALENGRALEIGQPAFGAAVSSSELAELITN